MRAVTLNASSAGMTRLRSKGGASPETLYELYNGYVTASRTTKQRPAVVYAHTLPTVSKGLVYFNGAHFIHLASAPVTPVAGSTNLVLIHPTPGFSGTVIRIWFAQPFMGLLYVVAEFSDNAIYHYWLQMPAAWQPFTQYKDGDLVQPTTPNGLYYRAYTANPPAAWQPLHQYSTNDVVQPTKYNGFQYFATNLLPSSPTSSSDTEPVWPTVSLALVPWSPRRAERACSRRRRRLRLPLPLVWVNGGRYTNIGGSGGRGWVWQYAGERCRGADA